MFLLVAFAALGIVLPQGIHVTPDAAVDEGDFRGTDAYYRAILVVKEFEMTVAEALDTGYVMGHIRDSVQSRTRYLSQR